MSKKKREKKPFQLTDTDKAVFNFLLAGFEDDPTKWFSKQEILDGVWQLKDNKPTSHDICSSLNNIRIRLNRGCSLGLVDRIILLNNGCFKIAKDKFEAEWYLKKDYRVGIKHLVRYYENTKVLKRNGQGQLLDPNGNPIDEEDANAMFRTIFAIGNNEAV